ncbi:MAG: hypothetical protein ACOCRO_09225, partial [Halanaerobiales bacterium]
LLSIILTNGSTEIIILVTIVSVIALIPYLAISEIIRLFIDLEENTRTSNLLLRRLIDKEK